MKAEERLRKYYIEEHNKGNNINIYANSVQCTKDIQEILTKFEEVRKYLKRTLNEEYIKIKNHKGTFKSTNYLMAINKRALCYELLEIIDDLRIGGDIND